MTSSAVNLRQTSAREVIFFPASFAQQRLWFLDQLTPGKATYNIPNALRIRGDLDIEVLNRALEEVMRRHETLRTRFVVAGSEPQQVIEEQINLQLPILDLSSITVGKDREVEAMRLAQEEARQPFDLQQAPLFRAKLLRLSTHDHVLLFTMHHIISDAWSMGVLVQEVSALYEAFSAGCPSPLPELPIQYSDYTMWQRECLEGGLLEQQLEYWKQQLAGSSLLNLPTDHPRPVLMSQTGATYEFVIPGNVTHQLKKLAEKQGATLFMVLLAALHTLLYRYSGQDDISVAAPIAGRSSTDAEQLIGFFVNTLVLRLDLSGKPGFTELLHKAREVTLQAYAHQDLPFEKLVEVLSPDRNLGATPLFQIMIVLQNAPRSDLRLGTAALLPFDNTDNGTAKFDLSFQFGEDGSGALAGSVEYNTDLFEPASIRRMINHYQILLSGIVANPDQSIAALPLLTNNERKQVTEEWNRTGEEIPQATLVELFEQQVRKNPDAVAVIQGKEQLSYRELNERANRLAHYLASLGVQRETIAGVALERSVDMVVAVLGVVKAGAAYMPIDPQYPAERIAFMLENSSVGAILTHSRIRSGLPVHCARTIEMDVESEEINKRSSENPASIVDTANAAYVIYTSGSTGLPKGVVVTHAGIAALSATHIKHLGLDSQSRVLQFSSLSFDASVWEIVMAFTTGAALVLIGNESRSGSQLRDLLITESVTHATLPPSILPTLENCGELPLKSLIVAGEPCSGELAGLWSQNRRMVNAYGPTETTVCATMSQPLSGSQPPPIGKPILNTRVYVLDGNLNASPVGVTGELYVSGPSLARGYLKQPDLTAERFIPNPFGAAGERMYKTGDLVRWKADGDLEYQTRADEQVKIRGFRIELGEIEAALREYAGIGQAVVTAREDEPGHKRLVAYFVAGSGNDNNDGRPELKVSELRGHLQRKLPEYMVPGAYIQMEALPLTPSGKIDRKGLPHPDAYTCEQEYAAPRNHVEETLCGLWQQILRRERVGVHDDFFRIGGHSLSIAQVANRIREVFMVDIPVRSIFETPTVASMAELIDQAMQLASVNDAQASSLPAIRRMPRRESEHGEVSFIASFAQQRLWFLDQLTPGRATYNIPIALRVRGSVDVELLEKTLGVIVGRHETLRTRFIALGGKPHQVIEEQIKVHMPVLDLTGELDDRRREAEAGRLAREEARQPFHLQQAPLFRGKLLRLGTYDHVLLFTMHHIISDAWSTGILVEEVSALYNALSSDRPLMLPELDIQYADYSAWQQECLEAGLLESQLSYWKEQLAGNSMLALPADRPRPAVQSEKGGIHEFVIDVNVVQKLKKLGAEQGASLFMVLLAAFQVLLYRYSGQQDIAVGTPIAGRNSSATEKLIGFFLNTLVLRVNLSGKLAFTELLLRAKEVTVGAYAHQDLPFEKLVEVLSPERNLGISPLFQVMITLQNTPDSDLRLANASLQPFDSTHNGTSKFDLLLHFGEDGSGALASFLEYNTDLFGPATIARMVDHYQVLLSAIVREPKRSIAELPLLTANERRQVIEEWNRTQEKVSEHKLVDLFEEQVSRTPDVIAVEFETEKLSYAELNVRANQLAHVLVERGIGPEDFVGICLERSLEMVISIWGVLKAGAAYLPLDPEYPPARVELMLADAQPKLLLTTTKAVKMLPQGVQQLLLDVPSTRQELITRSTSNLKDCDRIAPLSAQNPVYVIYTSGSTGRPKGIIMTVKAMVNLLAYHHAALTGGAGTRVAQFTSLSFDVSAQEILSALTSGKTLCIPREDVRRDPAEFVQWLDEHEIEELYAPNVMLEAVSEAVWQQGREMKSLTDLIQAGEALVPGDRMRKWFGQSEGKRHLHNHYGPGETHVVTACKLPGDASQWPARIPIGKPIINTRTYVLDEEMRPVPIGAIGELYLGGDGLGRGYLRRPDLTAERFGPDPFSLEGGERLYRTGDQVRWTEYGNLEYLGRVDHQVKIRGFRIELGEIEAALQEHAGVRQAIVMARQDHIGDKRLVAYLIAQPGDKEDKNRRVGLNISELREHLQRRLPEYMMPSAYVQLETMPLTPSGKVDRRNLPEPDTYTSDQEYMAPRNGIEETLCRLWEEVLHRERVGVYDDFFRIGGHSLLAAQVRVRMSAAFGVDVSLRQLFETKTIAELAKVVEHLKEAGEKHEIPPIVRVSRAQKLPLSFAQQRLWLLDQLEPGNRVYHIPTVLRLKGKLNIDVLSAALDEIVCRHEILRTSFPAAGELPWQMIQPPASVPLERADLRSIPLEFRESKLRELIDSHIQKPFDLAHGPLFRVALYITEEQQYVLCLSVHHIIYDAWSIPIFVRELNNLYSAFLNGKASPLPELPVQCADVAVWEREWLRDEALESHLRYWRQALEGAPQTLDLPTDFPRPSVQSFAAAMHMSRLSPELSLGLKQLSQRLGATDFMTLLAAMNVWLFRYSGQSDILVGTPVSNRHQLETEALIGMFVNTLVFRTRIDAAAPFTELVDQIRANALAVYAHQALPFEKLVEELQVVREPGRNPLFQVMLNMLTEVNDRLELAGAVEAEIIETDAGQARFDIHLNAFPTPAGLELTITYKSGMFLQSTIASMLEELAEMLRLIVENPQILVSELIENAMRFEQETALARKRDHSQQQGRQLRAARRRGSHT